RVDIARTIFRPPTAGPATGQNFLYDSARDQLRPLAAHELYRRLPISHRLCRVYATNAEHAPQIAAALDQMLGGDAIDDLTNM
ncbi:MAG TPA: metal-dependent phosphohydrolase, partial [Pirellulaceae bacterium]|nr:metal-dependent phosphohydrolase [Pirellulaceae bacterium]